jgi:FAD/FMN-containing dehydrogenase
VTAPDWDGLGGAIAGEVALPGSPRYEQTRRPGIPRFDELHPRAVVRCSTVTDVSRVIRFARATDTPLAIRSGGHCFAGRSSGEGIVLDVSPMRSVSVSGETAIVGAGARLGDVYDALAERRLTMAAGCGPEVGIAGLTLGGGLGILGRRHGLTSDQLLGAQVVLADGHVVECDERRHEELFWALRGAGGGQFGVVTSLKFRTVLEPFATSLKLVWPDSEAAAVLDAWQSWSPDGPDELAASLLVTASADPDRPPVATVFGACIGSEDVAAAHLDELVARVGVEPSLRKTRHLRYRAIKAHLAETGPGEERPGAHPYSKSEFFRGLLPAEAIEALLDNLRSDRRRGESRELDLTPWGGAYNLPSTEDTAFAHRGERFLLKHAAVVDPDTPGAELAAARGWLARSWEIVHPYASGGVYPNFPDPDMPGWEQAYHGSNYDRLVRVKRTYDPDGVFAFPQSIASNASSSEA